MNSPPSIIHHLHLDLTIEKVIKQKKKKGDEEEFDLFLSINQSTLPVDV